MTNTRAVTPLVAALLMIVISVAAFAALFAYTMFQVHRVAPEVIPKVELRIDTVKASFKNLTIYIRNEGDRPVTIDHVYLVNVTTNTAEYAANVTEVTIPPGEVKNVTIPLPFGLKTSIYKIVVSTKEAGKIEVARRYLSFIPAEAVSPLVLSLEQCTVNQGYQSNCCTIVIKAENRADRDVALKKLIIWSWSYNQLHESFWGKQIDSHFDFFAGASGKAWWLVNETWINESQIAEQHIQIPVGSHVRLECQRLGYKALGNYSFLDPFSPKNLVRVKAVVLYGSTPVETPTVTQGVTVKHNWFEPNPKRSYPYVAYSNGVVKMFFKNHAQKPLTQLYMHVWNYDKNKTYTYQNFTHITITLGSSKPPSATDQYNTSWSLVKTTTNKVKVSPTGEGAWLNLTSWLPASGIPAARNFALSFTLDPPPAQGSFIYIFLVAKFQDQTEYWFWCFIEVISP